MSKILFFAYGEHIGEDFMNSTFVKYEDKGKAKLKNARLSFRGIFVGVPTFDKEKGKCVYGRLYEISKKNFDTRALKVNEAYLYTKTKIKVITPGGKVVVAYTLRIKDIVNNDVGYRHNYITAKRGLYRIIEKGYESLGLNKSHLEEAAIYSMKKCYERDLYYGDSGEDY